MRLREFVDLAGVVAQHAESIIARTGGIEEHQLQEYWVASRGRVNRWGQQLRRLAALQVMEDADSSMSWRYESVLREILVSEMLTRCWATVLEGIDRRLGGREYGPVGRSVHLGHLDARGRVLRFLVAGQPSTGGLPFRDELNDQRLQIERWTDICLSYFPSECVVDDFAFDTSRVEVLRASRTDRVKWIDDLTIATAVAHELLGDDVRTAPFNDDLHSRVLGAVLGTLDPRVFSSSGVTVRGWSGRMLSLADETLGRLSDWLSPARTDESISSEGTGDLRRF